MKALDMARGRYIKPALAENEHLAKLTAHTRLLFVLLPCHADCMGRLEDRAQRLHIKIFPYEPKLNVDKMLQDLHESGFITRYAVDDENFIWINKFLHHQNPHKNERDTGSQIPEYSPESMIRSKNGTTPDSLGTDPALNLELKLKTEHVSVVFDHYKKVFEKTGAYKITDFRKKLIVKALDQGYTISQLIKVIDMMASDDWDQRHKFNDIRYALEITPKKDRVDEWLSKSAKTFRPTKKRDVNMEDWN